VKRLRLFKDASELPEQFSNGNPQVEHAEATQSSAEVATHPNTAEAGRVDRYPADVPIGKPGKDYEEGAQLKSEDDQAEVKYAPVPANQLSCAVKAGRSLRHRWRSAHATVPVVSSKSICRSDASFCLPVLAGSPLMYPVQ
jgi:hypothetical protein